MMIYVCDAVMGSGKTSATINYINNHPDDKFIYITPYLDEADRMISSCNMTKFETPNNKRSAYNNGRYSKLEDARNLISLGKNIASTHALFKTYDADILMMIRENRYKLIIDENVEVAEASDDTLIDINMLVENGYLFENLDEEAAVITYTINPDKEYGGGRFSTFFKMLESKQLTRSVGSKNDIEVQYYWTLPPELINSFEEVFVLTYLFENQGLSHMFKLHNMEYKNIGVSYNNNIYQFDFHNSVNYIPEYIRHLHEMIDIVEDDRYNFIGQNDHALSMSWFDRESNGDVLVLKKLIRSCFEYRWSESMNNTGGRKKNHKRLWGSYAKGKNKLSAKGYKSNFLVFNSRATNLYKDAEYLVYAVNLFNNVRYKKYYEKIGINISDDQYALSTMIQWIWRSAIRDGKPIHIYIPSRRMRELLINWINSFNRKDDMI